MSTKAIKDLYSVNPSIAPAAITSTAAGTGAAVDTANSIENMIVITPGTITDGTHTPTVQVSANGTTGWANVPATDLVGAFVALATGVIQKVSYIGAGQFLRVLSTVAGATTGGVYGAVIITKPRRQPAP